MVKSFASGVKLRKWLLFFLYYGVAKHLPISAYPGGRVSKRLRYICCKYLFRRCGTDVNVEHGADIMFGDTIEIGNRSGIGIDALIRADVVIGADVMMGPRVTLYGRDHLFQSTDIPMMDQGMGLAQPIVIEDDVWIGSNAVILKGVRVGKGSIVGAGSVVTKDVPSYSIVGGNPARILRSRMPISEKNDRTP